MLETLLARLAGRRRFIQVLAGARQTGKTTLARQALARIAYASHYASADGPAPKDATWIEQQWERARLLSGSAREPVLLVLDEVQKVSGWSEVVKACWDRDSFEDMPLKLLILGSAPLLVQRGLSESLAGRFEQLRVPHWSWPEMRGAFGWEVDQYVFFGGYPGAAPLVDDPERWGAYILDSLIETTVSRDILLLNRVDKPALLRRLFGLAASYSGQVLSYTKMLGQLQDAGNTTTLAHYLDLLRGAGMVAGLPKYAGQVVRRRASSPKLQVFNNALTTALSGRDFPVVRRTPDRWGRLVESAVGAHLLNSMQGTRIALGYWRDRNREVDFVLSRGDQLCAIEVKSGRRRGTLAGMRAFDKAFTPGRKLLVGTRGVPVEEFLSYPVGHWLG